MMVDLYEALLWGLVAFSGGLCVGLVLAGARGRS
jgi:hypothetical protein